MPASPEAAAMPPPPPVNVSETVSTTVSKVSSSEPPVLAAVTPNHMIEQRNPTIVKIVVVSISVLSFLNLSAIIACALMDKKPSESISTALITTLATLVGALVSILCNTKTVPPPSGVASHQE